MVSMESSDPPDNDFKMGVIAEEGIRVPTIRLPPDNFKRTTCQYKTIVNMCYL